MENQLKKLLKNQDNIQFAYLFGSYARHEAHKNSDVDIAIYFYKYSLDSYLEVHHLLTKALHKEVDITVLNSIKNLYLLENILLESRVIKDESEREYYEVMSMHKVIDYKNFKRYIDAA